MYYQNDIKHRGRNGIPEDASALGLRTITIFFPFGIKLLKEEDWTEVLGDFTGALTDGI